MARYLSTAWFGEISAIQAHGDRRPPGDAEVVLQQVVTGTDEGTVSYQVQVGAGWAAIVQGDSAPADATFTLGWDTATALAAGVLSTHAALAQGRIRVSGNLANLARTQLLLAGADPVPHSVRSTTTY